MKPAGPIAISERDYFLGLHKERWPHEELSLLLNHPIDEMVRSNWQAGSWKLEEPGESRFVSRVISRQVTGGESRALEEVVLRFPSCPLFGIQRERDYQFDLDPINYHTLRLLCPAFRQKDWCAERIFLIFNGLNETDRLDFYYDLSDLLIDQNTACIICALPGHLMRYPMVGRFAEKPLSRFIGDPSDLFRQYLRAMLETQWLLSILVPISHYPVVPGNVLLGSSHDPAAGRGNSVVLSQGIFSSWRRIWQSSARLIQPEVPAPEPRGGAVCEQEILQTVTSLRELIGWRPIEEPLAGNASIKELPPPRVHVIGYSLGGYLAQSVFFTWPFALGSCTTICSGGALQEIRPVKFAHEEEWRAVTHGLKYEVENGMLEQRIRLDPPDGPWPGRSVSGIPLPSFSSFFRIFNDVFLQEPNGSYRSRVSEFAPRLLFVVGGNDPIVTTRSVIAASPPEGVNLIEIANLSHFVAMEKGEWSDFWLPEVAKLLVSFATRTELLLSKAVLENRWKQGVQEPENETLPEARNHPRRGGHREPESLGSEKFQSELMSMINLLSAQNGFIFVLRNRIPTALMGPRLLERRGTVPHFEDQRIREYWLGLKERRMKMLESADRLALVLPRRLKNWFVKSGAILSAKSEPSSRSVPDEGTLQEIWRDFLAAWETEKGALYCFDPQDSSLGVDEREEGSLESLIRQHSRTPDGHPILNTLPDVWIGLSGEVVRGISGQQNSRAGVISGFQDHVRQIYQEVRSRKKDPRSTETSEWLESGDLRVIRVSSVSSNPRFLGERIWNLGGVLDLLIHSALALSRSRRCIQPGDFEL